MNTTPNRRSRSGRSERTRQLYTARALPEDPLSRQPSESDGGYAPSEGPWDGGASLPTEDGGFHAPVQEPVQAHNAAGEAYGSMDSYAPNEDVPPEKKAMPYDGYAPNQWPEETASPDRGAALAATPKAAPSREELYAAYTPNELDQPGQGANARYGSEQPEDDGLNQSTAPSSASPFSRAAQTPAPAFQKREAPQEEDKPQPASGRAQALTAALSEDTPTDEPEPAPPAPGSLAANLGAYYRPSALDEVRQKGGGSVSYGTGAPSENGVKLGYQSLYDTPMAAEPEDGEARPMNVYRPRAVTWAQPEERSAAQAAQGQGYQVAADAEEPRKRRRRKHRVRRIVMAVCAAAVLAGVGWFFREPIRQWIGTLTGTQTENNTTVAAVATAAPVHGYDAASPVQISANTSGAISQIAGTLDLEPAVVTQDSIMTGVQRENGNLDYYLFGAANGKLLAYFEDIAPGDMVPLPDGGYYVRQAPYLINADGSAMIQLADLEQQAGQPLVLHPLMNGWAMVETEDGRQLNYVNTEGQLLSRLWFARAFPMTGQQTVGYVDTGNLASADSRYALYVANADGTTLKWKDAADMNEVLTSVCGMAYLDNGELYLLKDISAPLLTTSEVSIYADCDAMVVKDAAGGKYGLFAHGEQHYDYLYDSIQPVACDIRWGRQVYQGLGGQAAVYTVTGAAYPQPLSHYFLLKNGAQEEYVALSTSSLCPVVLK